jgi:1-deoxy-D-xylulose-5-phosphate reductoisomerase
VRKKITILGSTGSIGANTLRVIESLPQKFEVYGLTANNNLNLLEKQIKKFNPQVVALMDEEKAEELEARVSKKEVKVHRGVEGLVKAVKAPEVDLVVSAIVGTAGLTPTLEAIRAGKDIALANKEILVMAGEVLLREAKSRGVNILPVDSEHNAIFQCLQGKNSSEVSKIILTASGGPFYNLPKEELERVTPPQALEHPTWEMGKKISVDSASLMNKGLEVIETKHLFGIDISRIEVVIHPQSIIHSLVEFVDGSVLAQLGITDMRIPIQSALTYPEKLNNPLPKLDLAAIANLTFEEPDLNLFPCLSYACTAG